MSELDENTHDTAALAIETVELTKRFGKALAVNKLSLRIPHGTVYGLLGPNGAGKSTTFAMLCGFIRPSSGQAQVMGVPAAKVYKLGGQVAVLPQDALFPPHVPVREELRHFAMLMGFEKSAARREVDRVLERVALPHVANMVGLELSHGMRKRVGLAQAMLGEPRLVLLDEPTAGLDPMAARTVKDIVMELSCAGCTVVYASHNLSEVQEVCTHAAIISDGHLVADGSISELTRRSAVVTVEVADSNAVPLGQLRNAYGPNAVRIGDDGRLRVEFPHSDDPAAVISDVLRLILAHETKVLSVSRGTSLEAAFLEITAPKKLSSGAQAPSQTL